MPMLDPTIRACAEYLRKHPEVHNWRGVNLGAKFYASQKNGFWSLHDRRSHGTIYRSSNLAHIMAEAMYYDPQITLTRDITQCRQYGLADEID